MSSSGARDGAAVAEGGAVGYDSPCGRRRGSFGGRRTRPRPGNGIGIPTGIPMGNTRVVQRTGPTGGGAAVGGGQLVGQQGGWPEAMASAETRFASRCGGGACGLCCDVHGRRTYSRKRSGNGRGWAHGGAKRKGQRNASNAVR